MAIINKASRSGSLIYMVGLSSFNQQSLPQKMIDHGADGYVLKNATREEITEVISTVKDGETF